MQKASHLICQSASKAFFKSNFIPISPPVHQQAVRGHGDEGLLSLAQDCEAGQTKYE